MEAATIQKVSSLPAGWRLWLSVSIAAYVLILLCTRPVAYVDSMNYATQIVEHYHHSVAPGSDPVWDFGHPLWRPAALAIWTVLHGPLIRIAPQEEVVAAVYAFIIMSVVGGFASMVLLFLTAARTTGKAWAAGVTSLGFIATAAVMNYTLTGTAYMAGGACQIGGLYLLCRSVEEDRLNARQGFAAGLFFGLSVCIWFPFVLSLGGYLCFSMLWPNGGNRGAFHKRIPYCAAILSGMAAVVFVVYAAIMLKAGITNIDAARAWIARSRYGISPTRGFLRVMAGIPRSFIWLGDAGSTWKRLLLTTGSRQSLGAWVHSGIWKLCAVYLALALTALGLWQSQRGRILLGCLLAIAVPLVLFAALLFDPSALERYYAAFPLLFLAFACLMEEARPAWFGRAVLSLFFGVMLAANATAMTRWSGNEGYENAVARLSSFQFMAGPNDVILLASGKDDANEFVEARPFAPESRVRYLIYIVLPQGSTHTLTWREDAASRIQDAWQHGGHAWVSLRLLAEQPAPDWGWVEGDDARIHWSDAPVFFHRFDLLNSFGGTDGFAEIARSPKNEQIVLEVLARLQNDHH